MRDFPPKLPGNEQAVLVKNGRNSELAVFPAGSIFR